MKQTSIMNRIVLSVAVVVSLTFAVTGGCEKKKEPVKVGFAACLTGKFSELGTSGRNGAMLATEEINAAGGVNGRAVSLITRDDRLDPQEALRVDKELIDLGVVAIIGHMTSNMSMAVLPLINQEKMLMISPTTSTNALSGMDDFFLRVIPANKSETDHLANLAFNSMNLRKLAVLYEVSNMAYTEDYYKNFKFQFETLGAKIIKAETFKSGDFNPKTIVDYILQAKPDGVLIVASPMDTAIVCQHLKKAAETHYRESMRGGFPVLSSGWAMTTDFIQNAGLSSEGVVFSQLVDEKSTYPSYLRFRENFRKRFGHDPSFAALHAYDAAKLLFRALKENADPKKLKEIILGFKTIHGVQGDFEMDQFGDTTCMRFPVVVKDGMFQILEKK